MKCKLCEREAQGELCQYHVEAKSAVETAFRYWTEAYGPMKRDEYLRRVAKNPETGAWAAEVAKMMLGAA